MIVLTILIPSRDAKFRIKTWASLYFCSLKHRARAVTFVTVVASKNASGSGGSSTSSWPSFWSPPPVLKYSSAESSSSAGSYGRGSRTITLIVVSRFRSVFSIRYSRIGTDIFLRFGHQLMYQKLFFIRLIIDINSRLFNQDSEGIQ